MALAIAENRISREEYLEGELASEIRHEYVAGNVYAMSGGTLNHQRIAETSWAMLRKASAQVSGMASAGVPKPTTQKVQTRSTVMRSFMRLSLSSVRGIS